MTEEMCRLMSVNSPPGEAAILDGSRILFSGCENLSSAHTLVVSYAASRFITA